MGWQQQKAMNLLDSSFLKQAFHILTITLLSLLLPLSFLLLSRISCANFYYLLTFTSTSPLSLESSTTLYDFSSLFLHSTPFILYILVSVVSISALYHALTGKVTVTVEPPLPIFRPRLYTSWIFLCTLQVCVGLGIEDSIATGVDNSTLTSFKKCDLVSKMVFFLGLHETMLHWCRFVVKPVVDDTVFGGARGERWAERGVLAATFGWLWWWRLRDEIESFVIVTLAKKEFEIDIGMTDFVSWWLYYVTVTIGMVRIVKGIIWLAVVLCSRRRVGTMSLLTTMVILKTKSEVVTPTHMDPW